MPDVRVLSAGRAHGVWRGPGGQAGRKLWWGRRQVNTLCLQVPAWPSRRRGCPCRRVTGGPSRGVPGSSVPSEQPLHSTRWARRTAWSRDLNDPQTALLPWGPLRPLLSVSHVDGVFVRAFGSPKFCNELDAPELRVGCSVVRWYLDLTVGTPTARSVVPWAKAAPSMQGGSRAGRSLGEAEAPCPSRWWPGALWRQQESWRCSLPSLLA